MFFCEGYRSKEGVLANIGKMEKLTTELRVFSILGNLISRWHVVISVQDLTDLSSVLIKVMPSEVNVTPLSGNGSLSLPLL
jgi:hypothetical protein